MVLVGLIQKPKWTQKQLPLTIQFLLFFHGMSMGDLNLYARHAYAFVQVFGLSDITLGNQNSNREEMLKKYRLQFKMWPSENHYMFTGWLGWAMVLGSFQCRGALLLLHIAGQGPAVLAAGAGRVGYIFYIFHLSSISNVLSFGSWLNLTKIL